MTPYIATAAVLLAVWALVELYLIRRRQNRVIKQAEAAIAEHDRRWNQ